MSALWPFQLAPASFFPVEEFITLNTGAELQFLWTGILAGQYQDAEIERLDYKSQIRQDAQILRPVDYPGLYTPSLKGKHIFAGIAGCYPHPLYMHPAHIDMMAGRLPPAPVPGLVGASPTQLTREMRCLLPDVPIVRGAPCLTARNAYLAAVLAQLAYKHRPSALYKTLYRGGWEHIVSFSVHDTEFMYLSRTCADPHPQIPATPSHHPAPFSKSPIGAPKAPGEGVMSVAFIVIRGTESVADATYDALFAGPVIKVPAFLSYPHAFERTTRLAHKYGVSGGDFRLACLLWAARHLDPTFESGSANEVAWFERRLAMSGVMPIPIRAIEDGLAPCEETQGRTHRTEFLHAGFVMAAKIVLRTVAHVRMSPPRERKVYYLAGHSLGGALACATARVLRACFGGAVAGVYTFGAPHLSTPQATRGLLPWQRHFHFVHGTDVVADASPVGLIGSIQRGAFEKPRHFLPLRWPRTNSPGIFVKPGGVGVVWPKRYRTMLNVCIPWTAMLQSCGRRVGPDHTASLGEVMSKLTPASQKWVRDSMAEYASIVARCRAAGRPVSDKDIDHCVGMAPPSCTPSAAHGHCKARFATSVRDTNDLDVFLEESLPWLEGDVRADTPVRRKGVIAPTILSSGFTVTPPYASPGAPIAGPLPVGGGGLPAPNPFAAPLARLTAGQMFEKRPCSLRRLRALGGPKRFVMDHKMFHYVSSTRAAWLTSLQVGATVPSEPIACEPLTWTSYPRSAAAGVMSADGGVVAESLLTRQAQLGGTPAFITAAQESGEAAHHRHKNHDVSDSGEPTVPPTAWGLAPGHMHLPGPRLWMRTALGDWGHHGDVERHIRGLTQQHLWSEPVITFLWVKMMERKAFFLGDVDVGRMVVDLVVAISRTRHPRRWVQEFFASMGVMAPSPFDRPGLVVGPVDVDHMIEFPDV